MGRANRVRTAIQPVLKQMTIVLKDGSSVRMPTVMNASKPLMLQVDTSNHPAWTGEAAGLTVEDARLAALLHRYKGFVQPIAASKPAEAEPREPVTGAAAKSGKAKS